MAISEERQAELDRLTVLVYRQLQAGHPIPAIRSQFESVEGADPDEVRWVLERGRERYNGYFDFYKLTHRREAQWIMLGCVLLLLVLAVILTNMGWPTHGRGRGIAITGIVVGFGGLGWGIWNWFTAELKGRRTDVSQL